MKQNVKVLIGVVVVAAVAVGAWAFGNGSLFQGRISTSRDISTRSSAPSTSTSTPITRGDFIKGLATQIAKFKGDNIAATKLGCFNDIKGTAIEPYACYMKAMKEQPFLMGYYNGGSDFLPNTPEVRFEAAMYIEQAYRLVKEPVSPASLTAYSDIGDPLYAPWVQSAANHGLMDVTPGKGLKFRPTEYLTIDEAATMFMNLNHFTCGNGVVCK